MKKGYKRTRNAKIQYERLTYNKKKLKHNKYMLITIKNAQIQQKNYKKHTHTQTRTKGGKMLIHTTKTLAHNHAQRVERC